MKLPIVAYGDPVLKKISSPIDQKFPDLNLLVSNMFETMYAASGVGLAAPQIGLAIRLFVIDATPFYEDQEEEKNDYKKVFINPVIYNEEGESWSFNEGCLSIPNIREDISRKPTISIKYYDEFWNYHDETFVGMIARVIQHEYDHIEGKLFTDRINPLRKTMLRSKLDAITKGAVNVDYKMRFPLVKKRR